MNENSLQIDSLLNICSAPDQPLKGRFLQDAFFSAFHNRAEFSITRDPIDQRIILIKLPDGTTHGFCLAAVTFLGGNGCHPVFKKRIQLKMWYKDAYFRLRKQGCKLHFLGIYHYEGNVVFVDFLPETYVRRKMHNSSAFVYVNDLYRAMQDGVACRKDFHGNTIVTVRINEFAGYISDKRQMCAANDEDLIKTFSGFNSVMPFGQWLKGGEIIEKMRQAQWPKWRETEWPGWYLEFEFYSYLQKNNVKNVYCKNTVPGISWEFDFDLFFPIHKFYGDLKASDCNKKDAPGNDKETVASAISRYGRLWYVIYEHDTVKDSACDGEVCKIRYELLLKNSADKAKSPDSYIKRMKNRIKFRRMLILELNRANCNEILKDFHQGRQPDGSSRAVKVLINKRNVENFQVFHYSAR